MFDGFWQLVVEKNVGLIGKLWVKKIIGLSDENYQ